MNQMQDLVSDLIARRELLGLSLNEVARRAAFKGGASHVKQLEESGYMPRSDILFAWCAALELEVKVVTVPRKEIPRSTGAQVAG